MRVVGFTYFSTCNTPRILDSEGRLIGWLLEPESPRRAFSDRRCIALLPGRDEWEVGGRVNGGYLGNMESAIFELGITQTETKLEARSDILLEPIFRLFQPGLDTETHSIEVSIIDIQSFGVWDLQRVRPTWILSWRRKQ